MTTPSRQRIVRDYKRLVYDPPEGINASPNPSNIMHWNAVIFGPEDTPWDEGIFKLTMKFSEDYPATAPVVKFVSKMFHPNIYPDGSICLDILQEKWNPLYDAGSILTSIQSLLTDPNPNSPANPEAAKLFSENKKVYLDQVKYCVQRSWMDEGSNEPLIESTDQQDPPILDPSQSGQQAEETEIKKSEIKENSSSASDTDETLEHCGSREDEDGKVYKRQKREEV